MKDLPTWDEYFMGIADQVAARSKDPTKTARNCKNKK